MVFLKLENRSIIRLIIESNEGGAAITIDNKVLYFTKCITQKNGYNNCDIYYVTNQNHELWSEVKAFREDISQIDSWESQPTVSSDGKTIIFSSDRRRWIWKDGFIRN